MSVIKVGYLISYDYDFVKISLPQIYDHVSEIIFAVDIEGKTWSGERFTISSEFWDWLEKFDTKYKVRIYKDQFYIAALSPMECDTRERNMLAKQMGRCDWYLQIDSDEYFVNFSRFAEQLRSFNPMGPVTIQCSVATLFKRLSSGYLMVGESVEKLSFATNNPHYDLARTNGSGNEILNWDNLVVHQSWARTPAEIQQKLNNWSHKQDFNTTSLFNLWNAIDEHNYYSLKDFHPLEPTIWPKLTYIEGSINDVLQRLKNEDGGMTERPVHRKKNMLSRSWKTIKSSLKKARSNS